MTGQAEEQDETGAPEKVAETELTVPIEYSDAIRQPGDESAEEVSYPNTEMPDERDGADEQADRAPQPGNTLAPSEPPREGGTITRETQDDD